MVSNQSHLEAIMDPTVGEPGLQPKKIIKIDLARQKVEAWLGSHCVHRFNCLSGDKEHPTDPGTFTIFRKHHPYTSQSYGTRMDYAMFFTLDGKALHQYHGSTPLPVLRVLRKLVGRRYGSYGCVRLDEDHAKALYEWAPIGTTVHVF